jgi:hypothetical protein
MEYERLDQFDLDRHKFLSLQVIQECPWLLRISERQQQTKELKGCPNEELRVIAPNHKGLQMPRQRVYRQTAPIVRVYNPQMRSIRLPCLEVVAIKGTAGDEERFDLGVRLKIDT